MIIIIYRLSGNQVDGLHQQIVVEIFIYLEQKVETDFSQRKGKSQSCDVENEGFERFTFIFNFQVIKGRKVWIRIVISESYFEMS